VTLNALPRQSRAATTSCAPLEYAMCAPSGDHAAASTHSAIAAAPPASEPWRSWRSEVSAM
jgi:hypothetical protein